MADVPPLSREERLEAWRKRCFLEPLPEDFLRESTSSSSSSAHLQPVSAPVGHHQRRHHHHHHHPHGGYSYPVQFGQGEHFGNIQGYLRITVQQVSRPLCDVLLGWVMDSRVRTYMSTVEYVLSSFQHSAVDTLPDQ